jgi:ABC-type amino acid transport system permease subunit
MFYLVVLALAAVIYGAFSRSGVAMTADHRLFIAIACYAVSTVLLRPMLLSMFRYVICVVTGVPSIRHSKSLMLGFVISALGLSMAAWSSRAAEMGGKLLQGLADDVSEVAVSKPAPKKGRAVNLSRENNHD